MMKPKLTDMFDRPSVTISSEVDEERVVEILEKCASLIQFASGIVGERGT